MVLCFILNVPFVIPTRVKHFYLSDVLAARRVQNEKKKMKECNTRHDVHLQIKVMEINKNIFIHNGVYFHNMCMNEVKYKQKRRMSFKKEEHYCIYKTQQI